MKFPIGVCDPSNTRRYRERTHLDYLIKSEEFYRISESMRYRTGDMETSMVRSHGGHFIRFTDLGLDEDSFYV